MMQQDVLATLANISRSTVNIQTSQSRTESQVFSFNVQIIAISHNLLFQQSEMHIFLCTL